MKVLGLLILVFSFSASAASPCKAKAIRAAMSKYAELGPIQGDAPVPDYRSAKIVGKEIIHSVAVDGNNDEEEYWTAYYKVVTSLAPACKVKSVKLTTVR